MFADVTGSRAGCLPLREAGADVKESGSFSGAGHLEVGGLLSQSPSLGKMGTQCQKPSPLTVEAEVFVRRGRGPEQGRGLKSAVRAEEHGPC